MYCYNLRHEYYFPGYNNHFNRKIIIVIRADYNLPDITNSTNDDLDLIF